MAKTGMLMKLTKLRARLFVWAIIFQFLFFVFNFYMSLKIIESRRGIQPVILTS